MRTLLTKTALTAGFALAMAFTFSCSGDDGGGDNNPVGGGTSSDNGGSSSGGSSSSGGGSSSSSYVCPEWEWKITTPATCETLQTTGRAKETETCKANPSIIKGEPREIVGSELEWGKWKLSGGVGKRCCQDDPNSICETSTEPLQECGTELYAPSLQFCQTGTNEVKERCGTATFTSTEFCQSPNVVKPLCGTEEYTSTEFCQAGTNAVLPLCGTATFTSTEFCQAGTNAVLPLCGTATFTSAEFCQAGTNAVLPLCGTATFTSTEFCQAGTNAVLPLCGTATYPATQFCDFRDEKLYKFKAIGAQTWMAENLNYDVPDNATDVCYQNDAANCVTYGRLYNWATAMAGSTSSAANPSGRQGVCPAGWHLPSDAEWTALTTFVGGESTAGTKLKANSSLWRTNTGTDDFGFSALPGGLGDSGYFFGVDEVGVWWSSTEYNASNAYTRNMDYDYAGVGRGVNDTSSLYSVRCVQD
jgi:uncharacterized protein (TIGR02145 family)